MKVAPASVTGMIKKLAKMKLVVYEPYQGVVLTMSGQKIALEVIRHHRLVELYLAEALGVPWDQVHDEAEKWEHILSEELEERMDIILGRPTTDPHGSPIPTQRGDIADPFDTSLSDLKPGQTATVAEVSDHDAALLRYLASKGLYPQTKIEVITITPLGDSVTIRVNDTEYALSREVTNHIQVTDVKSKPER